MPWLDEVQFGSTGLVPVVTQDAATGEVLMVAYANREALERTERSGRAHYWSRSRQRLWIKGETSGHIQEVVEVRVDCDGDSVLYRVRQTGPACHTLHRSCFFRSVQEGVLVESAGSGHILARVDEIIGERIRQPREGAYTNYLLDQGIDKILKKLGEETTEVVIAAKNDSPGDLRAETADLLFHLLVLLRARNLDLDAVWKELEARFGRAPGSRSDPSKRKSDV
jgi:phosphoribosyl-AMP cyclohydrolase / phosphoribosyl-ATP pyrophosphohydrolase